MSKFQQYFGLFLFEPQIREDGFYKFMCLQISKLDAIQGFTFFSIRFLDIKITSKIFFNQLCDIWLNLLQSNSFIIRGIFSVFCFAKFICISLNCEIPVTIHDASQICESQFIYHVTKYTPVRGFCYYAI